MSKYHDFPAKESDPTLAESKSLIISVKEARKILGKDAEQCGDKAIAMLVLKLMQIGQDLLKVKDLQD